MIYTYYIKEYNTNQPAKSNDEATEYTLDLPGYAKSEVQISIEDSVIHVSAANEKRGEVDRYVVLNDKVDANTIKATLENGVLTISAQYKAEARPRVVKVE